MALRWFPALADPVDRVGRAGVVQKLIRRPTPTPGEWDADMLGWRDKAEAVARVYRSLPPEEQAEAVLFGRNYGRELGLPRVISLAGSFYLWGPGDRSGGILILLGVEPDDLDPLTCGSLVEIERVRNRWGVPEEREVPVLLCRKPSETPQEVWARERPHWG